jgi:Enoyl-(Acyl carrier protein) reductase
LRSSPAEAADLAKELSPRRIAGNTVAPGAIATDFSGGMVRDNPELNKRVSDMTALGRAGVPDDIEPMIAALLSEEPPDAALYAHGAFDPLSPPAPGELVLWARARGYLGCPGRGIECAKGQSELSLICRMGGHR